MAVDVKHDTKRRKFYVDLEDGSQAKLTYQERSSGALDYAHTYVPDDHRGAGIAEELVVFALDHARDEGRSVIPSCPYVRHVMTEKRPEYRSLMASTDDGPEEDGAADDGGA